MAKPAVDDMVVEVIGFRTGPPAIDELYTGSAVFATFANPFALWWRQEPTRREGGKEGGEDRKANRQLIPEPFLRRMLAARLKG